MEIFHSGYSPFASTPRSYVLAPDCREPARVPGDKIIQCQGPLARFVGNSSSPTNLFFQRFLVHVSRSHLLLSVFSYLSRFLIGCLPCDLSTVLGLRKVTDFQFVYLASFLLK